MYFAQFYDYDLAGLLSPVTGDRSVIILDGREAWHTHHHIAIGEGRKRGYKAFRICKGESLTRIAKQTVLYPINTKTTE